MYEDAEILFSSRFVIYQRTVWLMKYYRNHSYNKD